jgi:hypothetical protein
MLDQVLVALFSSLESVAVWNARQCQQVDTLIEPDNRSEVTRYFVFSLFCCIILIFLCEKVACMVASPDKTTIAVLFCSIWCECPSNYHGFAIIIGGLS